MITREEYRKRKRMQQNKKKSVKPSVVTSVFRPVNKSRTSLTPPSNKSLDGDFIDGFHQIVSFLMKTIHKGWHLLNNISFIKNYNQKQDASFKRNESFITNNWSKRSKLKKYDNSKITKNNKPYQHLSHKDDTNVKPILNKNKHKKSNTTTKSYKTKPIKLDKTFVNMMKHK